MPEAKHDLYEDPTEKDLPTLLAELRDGDYRASQALSKYAKKKGAKAADLVPDLSAALLDLVTSFSNDRVFKTIDFHL